MKAINILIFFILVQLVLLSCSENESIDRGNLLPGISEETDSDNDIEPSRIKASFIDLEHFDAYGMRDPFIFVGNDNKYYLTFTDVQYSGLRLYASDNLLSWKKVNNYYDITKLSYWDYLQNKALENNVAVKLWAPKLYYVNHKYILLHTTNIQESAMVNANDMSMKNFSENFKDDSNDIENDFGHHHDPSFFHDELTGESWLVSRCATIRKFSSDLSSFDGDEIQINPEDYKMGHEGSQIKKIGNKYVWMGTGWSAAVSGDILQRGTYNLYYATANNIAGPYSKRKFVGRCLGHGTLFQDINGNWWCTAFQNGEYIDAEQMMEGIDPNKAWTMNKKGLTLVPMEVIINDDGVIIRALDPFYEKVGTEESPIPVR